MVTTVHLFCSPIAGPSVSQLYTGFGLLARRGDVHISLESGMPFSGHGSFVLLAAAVNDETRLVYDCMDGPEVEHDALAWCSTYFKRSYTSAIHGADDRIRPLGLNYIVYGPGDFRMRRTWWLLRGINRSNARGRLGMVTHVNRTLSRVAEMAVDFATAHHLDAGLHDSVGKSGCSSSMLEVYEHGPTVSSSPTILCLARTWDPERMRGDEADDWRDLNETRAQCIRALRTEFGPRFRGGLAPSPDAVRDYPDCVVDSALVRKGAYLAAMQSTDICITTRGLRGSNGCRLAEYVAASRAIVTEHPRYEVPGGFAENDHYLGFETIDQCVSNVRRLVDDAELRVSMMRANRDYYRRYVRPDAIVARSLEAAVHGDELERSGSMGNPSPALERRGNQD